MKLRILTSQEDSETCEALAKSLSDQLEYKVVMSPLWKSNRFHIVYGDPRNKIYQYNWLAEHSVPCPEFTLAFSEATHWVEEGHTVIGRTQIKGHDGSGIFIYTPEDTYSFPLAKVYTKYLDYSNEYRVSIYKGQVQGVYEKRRKNGANVNLIKTSENGYVLCEHNFIEPEQLREWALKCCAMTKSDIIGVDICWDGPTNRYAVLEVNTAPQLGPKMVCQMASMIVDSFHGELYAI